MARLSSIDRLPGETRELIGRLRQEGRTIDEILDALLEQGLVIPRSTLGRHVKNLDELGARLRESAAAAEALVRPLNEAGEDRMTRALVATMHSLLMDALAAQAGEDVPFDAEQFMFLARSLKDLGTARKSDAELTTRLVERAEERARKAAAERAETAVKAAVPGLSAEALRTIREQVYGIPS